MVGRRQGRAEIKSIVNGQERTATIGIVRSVSERPLKGALLPPSGLLEQHLEACDRHQRDRPHLDDLDVTAGDQLVELRSADPSQAARLLDPDCKRDDAALAQSPALLEVYPARIGPLVPTLTAA